MIPAHRIPSLATRGPQGPKEKAEYQPQVEPPRGLVKDALVKPCIAGADMCYSYAFSRLIVPEESLKQNIPRHALYLPRSTCHGGHTR